MPATAITLRVYCGGMRWRLSGTDTVEVWRGTEQIGTLTGNTLTFLVEHLLLTADMVSWVRGAPSALALPEATPPALPPPPRPARKPLATSPSPGPFTAEEKTLNAARRRARRKP